MLSFAGVLLLSMVQILEGGFTFKVRVAYISSTSICCHGIWFHFHCDCNQYYEFCLRNVESTGINDESCWDRIKRTPPDRKPEYIPGSSFGNSANPMVYKGDKWPGSIQIDILRFFGSVETNRITYESPLRAPFHNKRVDLRQNGGLRVYMYLSLECSPNHYGEGCDVMCISSDNRFTGYYTCGSDGQPVCREGWSNPGNGCKDAVCAEGCNTTYGYCNDPGKCDCLPGWTGQNCDSCIAHSECESEGGYCIGPNQCICREHYNGPNCQIFEGPDECQRYLICNGRGECAAVGTDSHTCQCDTGFTGVNCETNIDDCEGVLCHNEGKCVDGVDSYHCACAAGWNGTHCEENINECEKVTCQHGAACQDLLNNFRCNCLNGYTGKYCETNIDDCESTPCGQYGFCTDQVGGYFCNCYNDFNGSNCELDLNKCRSSPCSNRGQCENKINDFDCNCPTPYTGKTCIFKFCDSNPCQNSGTCENIPGGYECTCPAKISGTNCEITSAVEISVVTIILIVLGIIINLCILVIIIIAIVVYYFKKRNRLTRAKISSHHHKHRSHRRRHNDNIYQL